MPASYKPPGVNSLADMDSADTTYGDQLVVVQGVVSPLGQGGAPGKNGKIRGALLQFRSIAPCWRATG